MELDWGWGGGGGGLGVTTTINTVLLPCGDEGRPENSEHSPFFSKLCMML